MKMDEEEKIDEKMLEFTDIFNELTTNAIDLSKDIVVGIDAIRYNSYFLVIISGFLYLMGNSYGWNWKWIIALLGFLTMAVLSYRSFRILKSKYSEIYQLKEQLLTMKE